MPHLTIEYSPNLEALVDMDAVCEAVRAAAVATGVFPLGGIRVRAHRCDHAAIADRHPANAFADLTVRIGEGRDLATRQRAGEAVFSALCAALVPAEARVTLAISLNMYEIPAATAWKKNAIHDAVQSRKV
jgi:5-carboxymethyl-2-hydroxymuconate isomerase